MIRVVDPLVNHKVQERAMRSLVLQYRMMILLVVWILIALFVVLISECWSIHKRWFSFSFDILIASGPI